MLEAEFKNTIKEYWERWTQSNKELSDYIEKILLYSAKTGKVKFKLENKFGLVEQFKNRYDLEDFFKNKYDFKSVYVSVNLEERSIDLKNKSFLVKVLTVLCELLPFRSAYVKNGYIVSFDLNS